MSKTRSSALVLCLSLVLSVLVVLPTAAQPLDYTSSALFEKTLLTGDVGEPMTMDIASDGRVFLTSRSGTLRVHDQSTGQTTVAAEIDTYTTNFPGGSNEGGLLGVELDPDFDDNQWIYLYYADPAPSSNRNVLMRYEMDGNTLDQDSGVEVMEVEQQRQTCCHVAGDLVFGPDGNLYLSTGDETQPGCAGQYSPIDERPGVAWCDAQGTAGDTSDLRGKILRITPQPDGSYTIPEGNLFPPDEFDPEVARPEIYVMGARNPFRMEFDSQTGFLYYGMYGPDNANWSVQRGPMGFDQYHEVQEASNMGWPFCTGNNYPYRPWDFATNQPKGDFFDCDGGPVNTSPNNNGLEKLPPVTPATIYYPTNWNNYPNEVPEVFRALGAGAGGPHSGPVYRYDEELDSDTKFPEHFDGRWFLLEWHRNFIKTAALEDGTVTEIENFMTGTGWNRPHDAQFGPEGSLYVLEYGSGWFSGASDNGLYRIDYVGEDGATDPGGPTEPIEPNVCYESVFDDFDGDALGDAWTVVREDASGYRVADGALGLDTGLGDMIREHTSAQNLIVQDVPNDGGWQVTTEMTFSPTDAWQQAGLVLYDSDNQFIKFPLAWAGDNRHIEYIWQVNGNPRAEGADWIVAPQDTPDTIQMRMVSEDGTEVLGEYSPDGGDSWFPVGRPAPLNGFTNPKAGLLAMRGPDAGPVAEASFDWFNLEIETGRAGPSDDFESDELDRCIWPTIVRENADGYRVQDGALEIDTLQGDQHISGGNPEPNGQNLIMQPLPNGGWEATTDISIAASAQWQHAGFVVYGDDENFIKAVMGYQGDIEFLQFVDGAMVRTPGDVNPLGSHPGSYQLRLTSENGTHVSISYSLNDGASWTPMGTAVPLPDNAQIGLYAAGGPNADTPRIPARFHSFTLEAEITEPEPEPVLECDDPTIQDGYRSLWDGETLDGWNMAGPGHFDIVEDVDREGTCALETVNGMGLLWHEEEFESYRLRFDFKALAADDNSGVFFGFPNPGNDPFVAVNQGYEIQIDDTGGSPGAADRSKTGSIYTYQAPTSFPSVVGEWNSMEIEVDAPMVRVWINDILVNEYEDPANSGRDLTSGHVGLQNNRPSDKVFFRDIQVRELGDEPDVPTVDASLNPAAPDGDNDWYVSDVTLTLTADPEDAPLSWRVAGTEDWATYGAPVVFDADGTYDLEYQAGAEASEPQDVTVEVGPDDTWTFAPNPVTATQGDTIVYEHITGFHNVVTVDENMNQIATSGSPSDNWSEPYEFTADQAGTFYIYCAPHANGAGIDDPADLVGMFARVDVAPAGSGVSELGEVSFQIDQTAPVTSADVSGDGPAVLSLDAVDVTSGVAQTHWRVAGDEGHEVYDGPVSFDEVGSTTVEFRSVDVAGNVEGWQEVVVTVVGDTPEIELELAASGRCVAGNVFVTVTARNDNAGPVDVEFVSEYGSRAFSSVASDRFASHAFNTRSSSLDGGSVTVRSTLVIDGVEVSDEQTVEFDAFSC